MKFAHLGDCHLGGWRLPELSSLNFQSFQIAISKCISEKVDFVLMAGDLFDSAYPPIETLKETFEEFRKLSDANIPVFLIAGSHDFSASGKTFLDVLEKAGFCKNVSVYEDHQGSIMLQPTIFKDIAIYGYPGKKSGLEVDEIAKIKIQDAPGLFKILMLHTTIQDAIGSLPIKAVDEKKLPKVDYLALAHLHINYKKENRVYSGPIFPNNISELEDLQEGSFYIYDSGSVRQEKIKLKDVSVINLELTNSISATEEIVSYLKTQELKDKIVILKLKGVLGQGNVSDIDFQKIESFIRQEGAFTFLKNTSKLHTQETKLDLEIRDSPDYEEKIIEKFQENHESKFNTMIPQILKALQIEKIEDEKLSVFQDRLVSECKKIIQV